jgi:2-desacetyl-2-hydroxyethyl bacteriochlorophyllide A dehydrogenase
LPAPDAGQLLVKVHCSAISAGTELLVYRGQLPADSQLDTSIPALQGSSAFPLQYGYACVGDVIQLGAGVDPRWLNRRVFAFQPHASHFIAAPDTLITIPDDVSDDAALFLANMETAVNLVHDGAPLAGEKIVVFGQGIVGVLLLQLLRQFPLDTLHAVEPLAPRRQRAQKMGADTTSDVMALKQVLGERGADLLYEVSGAPAALNNAIELSGYCSRIVIGSWYGNKISALALGGAAHRNRLQFITSQVSSVAPQLSGRWDKQRRFDVAWQQIRQLRPQQWITQRQPLSSAPALYQRLHKSESTDDLLQAVFVYPS